MKCQTILFHLHGAKELFHRLQRKKEEKKVRGIKMNLPTRKLFELLKCIHSFFPYTQIIKQLLCIIPINSKWSDANQSQVFAQQIHLKISQFKVIKEIDGKKTYPKEVRSHLRFSVTLYPLLSSQTLTLRWAGLEDGKVIRYGVWRRKGLYPMMVKAIRERRWGNAFPLLLMTDDGCEISFFTYFLLCFNGGEMVNV